MQYKSLFYYMGYKNFQLFILFIIEAKNKAFAQSNDRYLDNQCSIVFNVHPDYGSKRTNVDNLSLLYSSRTLGCLNTNSM